jgi:hypothetical protein
MEPITATLVAALAKLAEPAVRDAYEGVKTIIARKFSGVHEAVEKVEQDTKSQGRQIVLGEEIEKAGAHDDSELKAALEALRAKLGQGANGGVTVTQNVSGSHNIFSGTGDVRVENR